MEVSDLTDYKKLYFTCFLLLQMLWNPLNMQITELRKKYW